MANSHDKLFAVLALLRRSSNPLTLTEIARAVNIAPSSAHAILRVLVDHSALTIDAEKRYRLGPAIFYLGASFARNSPLYRSTWNELVRLSHDLGLACAIAIPWDQHFLVLAVQQTGEPGVGVPLGSRIPLFAGAYGKIYAAYTRAEPTELAPFTEHSLTDIVEFRRACEEARRVGYGVDRNEFVDGVGTITGGVTSEYGFVGLAVVMGPVERVDSIGYAAVGERLSSLASSASVILGDASREKVWGEFH